MLPYTRQENAIKPCGSSYLYESLFGQLVMGPGVSALFHEVLPSINKKKIKPKEIDSLGILQLWGKSEECMDSLCWNPSTEADEVPRQETQLEVKLNVEQLCHCFIA